MISLWVLAFLAQPECTVNRQTATKVVQEAMRQEQSYSLPPGMLLSVILAESGGRPSVIATGVGRGKRGCDVGVAQIHVRDCLPGRVAEMLDVEKNIEEAALILSRSRAVCGLRKIKCCADSRWCLYNSGSRKWGPRVHRIHRRLLAWIFSQDLSS